MAHYQVSSESNAMAFAVTRSQTDIGKVEERPDTRMTLGPDLTFFIYIFNLFDITLSNITSKNSARNKFAKASQSLEIIKMLKRQEKKLAQI